MLSPRKEPPHNASRNRAAASPRTSTAIPLNGLFINGTWCCNCPNRPPAIKLQTKNNGVNHGRWFWTCQQPQQNANQRCNFFLWANDAEVREKIVVLSNSKSETETSTTEAGMNGPTTPSKRSRMSFGDKGDNGNGLLTPQTERKIRDFFTPVSGTRSARMTMIGEDDTELFNNDDDDIGTGKGMSFMDRLKQVQSGNAGEESPRKALRTATTTSPGRRKISDIVDNERLQTQQGLFGTPSQPQISPAQAQSFSPTQPLTQRSPSFSWTPNRAPPSSAEICTTPTPTKYKNVLTSSPSSSQTAQQRSDLANQAIFLLESQYVIIPHSTQEDLVELLNKFDLRMKGISRGRDISREVLKKKEEEIMRLNERLKNLERQREMDGAALGGC
ncbi:uncharacterized protein ACHE_70188A [Aspergillus chevalieri]|uniref:GRF-type domain-containing protein n=1 Tax=Aspergillus chevalieri TaxID=182096 RepID=A0A7R7VVE4_ASPCH|nr:uncharacterized protein ACHE_70188A [Aspergillus chevalieri]BCR91345.1 hypothetical protein ACHE_70188A [Aspergillus chevalieri]